jgi:pimeloyl-ACP methyl ester carboxylesterase
VTFAHRGYPPGTEIGVPDPKEFGGDLAALIGQLALPDVRLVGQSMGGATCIEYLLAYPQNKVRALVLASSAGTVSRHSVPTDDPQQLSDWLRKAGAARADMARRGISPPAGERMAREQPALHFLYRAIANASNAFDRETLRKRLQTIPRRSTDQFRSIAVPTLFINGEEDTTYPPFLSDALAKLMPNARVEHVPAAGHSVYFERASAFNKFVDNFFSAAG